VCEGRRNAYPTPPAKQPENPRQIYNMSFTLGFNISIVIVKAGK